MVKETKIISWKQDFFVHHRIISSVKIVEFVSDRLSYTGRPRSYGHSSRADSESKTLRENVRTSHLVTNHTTPHHTFTEKRCW